MKISEILKEAFLYQWFNVLWGRFYSDRATTLPIDHIKRENAKKLTFSWAFSVFVGINILVFIFFVFRYVNTLIPVIISFFVILLCSLILSCAASWVYIAVCSYIGLKERKDLKK